ncbi:MAG: hypothetical protein IPL59_02810 [Candidatus Competibacteraceae bacterium]|nr:hypothetical protein [Candidatus Competibacteraceae bacterium]
MIRNRWKLFSGIALLTFSIQRTLAGEAWLVITSDPPGAVISIDDAYRGVTPQHPGDALRVKVAEGTRKIDARVRIDGKEYAVRQVVEAQGEGENHVQVNLREEVVRTLAAPITSPVQASKPPFGTVIPDGKLEVPGRNF